MKRVWIILLSLIAMMFSVAHAETGIETPLVVWLEGEEYEMPCKLSELLDDGWVLHELNSIGTGYKEVDTKYNVSAIEARNKYVLIRKGKTLEIELKNEYPMPVELERCMVAMLNVHDDLDSPADMSYEGLRLGRTNKKAFSQWAEVVTNSNSAYVIDASAERNYKCMVYVGWYDNGKIRDLLIYAEHLTYTQEALNELEAEEVYRPASFDSYIEPVMLDKDWTTGMILLDGKLYQLPTPIEQFVQDGWVVEESWVFPGKKVEGRMTKGGKTVQLYAHNIMGNSDGKMGKTAKLSNCEADGISSRDGVYMRSGRFETGMSEFEMKLIGSMSAGGKLTCVDEWKEQQYEGGKTKNVTVKQYELVTEKMPEGLLKKPEGYNHMHYKVSLYVEDGIVTGMEASY